MNSTFQFKSSTKQTDEDKSFRISVSSSQSGNLGGFRRPTTTMEILTHNKQAFSGQQHVKVKQQSDWLKTYSTKFGEVFKSKTPSRLDSLKNDIGKKKFEPKVTNNNLE